MKTMDTHDGRRNVVVIGNGMVGQRFCEQLVERDTKRQFRLITFCEEPRAAYDRVGLTSFFAHRDAQKLMMAKMAWYEANGVELHVGDRASDIDRQAKVVRSDKGVEVSYDTVVLATGSFPFVPPLPGIEKRGVFVYRTRGPGENYRLRQRGEARRRHRRRPARPRGGQGGVRPQPANARGGIRPAPDAAADRRRRLARPGAQD